MALDPMTLLFNRKAFDEHLQTISELVMLSGKSATLLMIDIDKFKEINDTHGHPAGDAVIRAVAEVCTNTFPRRPDFVARYGGEEFAVILQQDGIAVGEKLAKRLLSRVRDLVVSHEGTDLSVTVSIGATELGEGEIATSWLKRADEALYEAKRAGRNRVVVA